MLNTRTALIVIMLGLFSGGASQMLGSGAKPGQPPAQHTAKTPSGSPNFQLQPPQTGAALAEWERFGRQVAAAHTGSRHDNRDYTTPLLPWYAYIASQEPQAIYTLYRERLINGRILSHLIQFGLLPDWYEELEDASKLLLNEPVALTNLAVYRGSDFARAETIELFRSGAADGTTVSIAPLLFALSGMSDNELEQVMMKLQNGAMQIDPRSLRVLMQEPRLQSREAEILEVMRQQGSGSYSPDAGSRIMSSYFLHGAELGGSDYVERLVADVVDNNKQPSNFYCAACALALVTDGLSGSELVEAVKAGRHIGVSEQVDDNPFFSSDDTPKGHEYLLSRSEGGW